MDRDEALRLLKGGPEGVKEWNRRREAGEEIPNLNGADLSGSKLAGARLTCANLVGADLTDADLRGTNFRGADLRDADLSRGNLSGAFLGGTDLRRAVLSIGNLRDSVLNSADLSLADLSSAFLDGTDIRRAKCFLTGFLGVDLSGVKGLDDIRHLGPSRLGIDTLILSRGHIPASFLRGCGVPERWVELLPSLIGALEPIQFYSCFISYSHQDEDFARRLHGRMGQEKLRVWYSPQNIRGGQKIVDQIEQAIRVHDKLLLVLTEASMGSPWVEHELREALRREDQEKRRVLFPIRLCGWEAVKGWKCFDADMGRDMARLVREYHIPDFSGWKDHDAFEAAFARLLGDLKAEASVGKP